jgi:hypothetical protein
VTAHVVAAALALGVAFYVLHPLFGGRSWPMGRAEEERVEHGERTRALLRTLRDLERDRRSGELDEKDYRALRSVLAPEALRALDREAGRGRKEASAPPPRDVEAEIARLRSSLRKERGE